MNEVCFPHSISLTANWCLYNSSASDRLVFKSLLSSFFNKKYKKKKTLMNLSFFFHVKVGMECIYLPHEKKTQRNFTQKITLNKTIFI